MIHPINTHITKILDRFEFIFTVIPIPNTNLEDYFCKSIADIISLLVDPKSTVPSLSFRGDTQNSLKQITTLLNRAIPAPKSTKTTLTLSFPSSHIAIGINSKTNSSCTTPCTRF